MHRGVPAPRDQLRVVASEQARNLRQRDDLGLSDRAFHAQHVLREVQIEIVGVANRELFRLNPVDRWDERSIHREFDRNRERQDISVWELVAVFLRRQRVVDHRDDVRGIR